jgi:hypothetical protein
VNYPRWRIEVGRDLVNVIEKDLVFLRVTRGAELDHLANVRKGRD